MTTSATDKTTKVNFTIDGKPVSVPKGTTVYSAAKDLGIDIPIFCYQDRMPPFGACRVCLVEVEKMPKLQTSCTLEATEGMAVKTQSQIAVEGRKGILEFLLINHPLDCPICDRGGECPLQDQALQFGPGMSRFFEEKRHFTKAYPLGPVLMLDRERCIVCARCTRFGEIVAGDSALQFIDRGFKTEVGTPDGRAADSKFIGNTINICPVGALTSEVYRFRARPWDNKATESTCTLCPVGCSLFLDSRDGEIMRTRSCENKEVNDMWLCDKGWFGYEYVYHPDRLEQPLIRHQGKLVPASWEEAITLIAQKLREAKPGGKIAGFGGNPLTTEENYLFQMLIREGAGVHHLDHRIGMPIFSREEEGIEPGMEMTIGACEDLSYAVLFGLDLTEEFPVIWLRLNRAIQQGAKVIFIGHYAPEIEKHLFKTILHAPGQELQALKEHLPELDALMKGGKKGAFFVGRQYSASPHRRKILAELLKLSRSTPSLSLNIMEGRGNSMGARLAGMQPDSGPLGQRIDQPGLNAVQVLEQTRVSGWDFLYVAGADPAAKFPSSLWKEARARLEFLVVQDLFLSETAQEADVVLPTLSALEKWGTFINIERRVQKLFPGKDIPQEIYSDSEIFKFIAHKLDLELALDIGFTETLKAGRFIQKQKNSLYLETPAVVDSKPRNGELSATFAHALFDHGIRMKHNPHVVQLTKEPRARLNPHEGSKHKIADGVRVRIQANGHSIRAITVLDKRVADNTVVLPLGFSEVPVHELGTNLLSGLSVELVLDQEQ